MYITHIKTYVVFPNGVSKHTLRDILVDPGRQWYSHAGVVRVVGNAAKGKPEQTSHSVSSRTVPIRFWAIKDL